MHPKQALLTLGRKVLLDVGKDRRLGFLIRLGHTLLLDHPIPEIVPARVGEPLLLDDGSGMTGGATVVGFRDSGRIRQVFEFGIGLNLDGGSTARGIRLRHRLRRTHRIIGLARRHLRQQE